ncbi:PaaI family thioesterase [Rhodococcus sp. D2-41]|uniref:PaaI family thioesterase n=1 Tax=Speluncibacter jeojiensis TaxID=2710754 RepID=A0A9X4RFD7_9ACTN|nr:PaaI family thioesterase [Rhodococcus sp. D2-41]MDG3009150.1 PaaI family thioesterase [Rhodococcus sp. D2-41]MDG3016177.1 PaaI family thioesterase [Corynebacteriales bacterium D3-21]
MQPPSVDRVNDAMGVTLQDRGETGLTYAQELGPRFLDHRGVMPLGAVGVLLETAVAGAVLHALPPGGHSVASSLSVSAASTLPLDGKVSVTGRMLNFDSDAGVGLGSGELLDADGNVCATAVARGIVVTRPVDSSAVGEALTQVPPSGARLEPEPDGRYGLDVVRAIAFGDVARGPLADLLQVELRVVDTGLVTGALAPQLWMSNELGSVQGGVLFAAADLLSGLAAQTVTEPGQRYRMLDLRTDFVRSPSLTGPEIHIESEVVRVGRRIELVETRLTGSSNGKLMARSFATVHRM